MQTVLRIKQLENDDFIIKVGYQKREFFQKEKKSQHKSRVCKTLKLRITLKHHKKDASSNITFTKKVNKPISTTTIFHSQSSS